MSTDISLECACGKLRGRALSVSPAAGTRVLCYCDDCQAFARFLGLPGILDDRGGTDIFQTAPSKVQLTSGLEALACVRLSEKGMHRWYCSECKTPLGNTLGAGMPFVGLLHTCLRPEREGRTLDEVLGPPLARVQTRFASAPVPAQPLATVRVIARTLRLLAGWWLARAGSPSPFFDAATGAPRVAPRVLSAAERRALDRPPP